MGIRGEVLYRTIGSGEAGQPGVRIDRDSAYGTRSPVRHIRVGAVRTDIDCLYSALGSRVSGVGGPRLPFSRETPRREVLQLERGSRSFCFPS